MAEAAARAGDPIRVLFVEDLPADAETAERALRQGGLEPLSRRIQTEEAYLEALASFAPDIVISDYSMPAFDGMSALRLAKESHPFLPFIILTGALNESTAVECMKAGASDYVIKEHMTRLPFAVKEAIGRKKGLQLSAEAAIELGESEARYRALFESNHVVKLIIDPADGAIVEANSAACVFYGWPKEELLRRNLSDINAMSPEALTRNLERALEGKSNRFLFRHRRADGGIVDVEVYSGPILLGGRPHLFSIVHDISARISAERELAELSSRLDHYLSTSPTVTYSLRIKDGTAQWLWASENIRELLGFSLAEVLEPDWWLRSIQASDRKEALGGISKLIFKGSFGQEYRFHRKDRSLVWLRDEMRIAQSVKGEAEVVGTLTDISERKKVEAELSLKSSALEAAANAIVITDREGGIQWANAAFESLSGYARDEAIGKNPRQLMKSGEHELGFYEALWETILSGRVWQGEITNRRKNGERYAEEMTITPVFDESRRISGFIAVKSDISERALARERLKASLIEKDILLREIHHRVNNNMQLIISLLSVSAQKNPDPELQRILGGISRRLESMALVHEQFYNAPDLARIDFVFYLHQLAEGLVGSFPGYAGGIRVTADAETSLLDLEKAIPAGLLAAELIANAVQHAYPGEEKPRGILVALRGAGGSLELSVRDEGVGLPSGFSIEKAESLGMVLIKTLATQLRGSVEFRSERGTEAVLRFPRL